MAYCSYHSFAGIIIRHNFYFTVITYPLYPSNALVFNRILQVII